MPLITALKDKKGKLKIHQIVINKSHSSILSIIGTQIRLTSAKESKDIWKVGKGT